MLRKITTSLICLTFISAFAIFASGCNETEKKEPQKTEKAAETKVDKKSVKEKPTEAKKETPAQPEAKSDSGITKVGEKVSYGMGLKMGKYLKAKEFDGFNIELLFDGIKDGLSGGEQKISEKDLQIAFEEMKKLQEEKAKAEAQANLQKGKDFLTENGKREGVITTKSGLQYEIIKKGNGDKPKATDKVTTHYRGTLIDGTEFDSSYSRNKPATFALNRVIKGWTEGLQLISVGSKAKLYIPSELAYGARPSPKIPANSTLVFEIELLEIAKDAPKPKTQPKPQPKAKPKKKPEAKVKPTNTEKK